MVSNSSLSGKWQKGVGWGKEEKGDGGERERKEKEKAGKGWCGGEEERAWRERGAGPGKSGWRMQPELDIGLYTFVQTQSNPWKPSPHAPNP